MLKRQMIAAGYAVGLPLAVTVAVVAAAAAAQTAAARGIRHRVHQ
jgi:hypothetical protein